MQGSVNPDEFYVYKPNISAKKPAILSKRLGGKAIEMVYAEADSYTKSTIIQDVDEARRKKFCLNTKQIESLAKQAMIIEEHYGRPMDVEWALDGGNDELYIVQARPETVKSRSDHQVIER